MTKYLAMGFIGKQYLQILHSTLLYLLKNCENSIKLNIFLEMIYYFIELPHFALKI